MACQPHAQYCFVRTANWLAGSRHRTTVGQIKIDRTGAGRFDRAEIETQRTSRPGTCRVGQTGGIARLNLSAKIRCLFVQGIHFQEYAKLEYGRLLWRVPAYRERLLRHWRDPRHPHAGRFAEHEAEVTQLLASPKDSDEVMDAELRKRNLSLRAVVKEIPS